VIKAKKEIWQRTSFWEVKGFMPPGNVHLCTGKGKYDHFFNPRLLLEEQLVLSKKLTMAGRRQCKDS